MQIKLNKLIQKSLLPLLNRIQKTIDTPIGFTDASGKLLWGEIDRTLEQRYPVKLAGNVIGWIVGEREVEPLAELLTRIADEFLEKNYLANETLDRYREINLLYNIAEKLTACRQVKQVASLALEEAQRLIPSTCVTLSLVSQPTHKLEMLMAVGKKSLQQTALAVGEGVADYVASTGKPEIVNNLPADPRYIVEDVKDATIESVVSAPLKAKDQVIGVIQVYSEQPINYTAAHLKLLNAIALACAPAIENALFYERQIEEARIREAKLQQQLQELQIEFEEAKRAKQVIATILFSDIKGFSTISERMPPEVLMSWLNEYLSAMSREVIAHHGVINSFMGDGIMAVFGVPIKRTTETEIAADAMRAVNCALAMSDGLKALNRNWESQRLPVIQIRAGIFTGPVMIGSLGGKEHLEYGVIGDSTNTAARLESYEKDRQVDDCRILIAKETLVYLQEEFEVESWGLLELKGKQQKIDVYRVVGRKVEAHSKEI